MLDLTSIGRKGSQLVLHGSEGMQFGKRVVTIQCTVNDVLKFIDIDRSVQRELNTDKVGSISAYLHSGLDGRDIYVAPLLFSARGRGMYNSATRQYSLDTGDRLYVLDGQHRIKAFEQLRNRFESMLERAPNEDIEKMYSNLIQFPLTIQVFTHLSKDEERQLFTDVNLKASPVHNTLLLMYGDSSKDLYTQMVKDIIAADDHDLFETRARTTRTKLMTAATLYLLCKTLSEGIFHSKKSTTLTSENYERYKKRVQDFLQSYMKILPKHYLDRDRYVVSVPNVILAIGKYVHDVLDVSPQTPILTLMRRLNGFDWTHRNKDFRKLGIDYNHRTQKYSFNAIGRVVPKLAGLLIERTQSKEGRL